MSAIQDTAYPRLRSQVTTPELAEIYTPGPEELSLARRLTKGSAAQLGFLVLLKVFQRLGYFVPISEVPPAIIAHIANSSRLEGSIDKISDYDRSGTRARHVQSIRRHLGVKTYDRSALRVITAGMREAARNKDELADLINVAIEELVRQRWELPAFGTLQRAALHVRAMVYRKYYREIGRRLAGDVIHRLNALLRPDHNSRRSEWNDLKTEPANASLVHFRELVSRHQLLETQSATVATALVGVPDIKLKHFAAEARTLDAGRMRALEPQKRYALAASLLVVQSRQSLDDLAEMFIKRVRRMHKRGQDALIQHRTHHQERTDHLIGTLRNVVTAFNSEGSAEERLAAIGSVLGDQSEQLIDQCDSLHAYAGNNY